MADHQAGGEQQLVEMTEVGAALSRESSNDAFDGRWW